MNTAILILFVLGALGGMALRRQNPTLGSGMLVVCALLAVGLAVSRLVASARAPAQYQTLVSELATTHRVMAAELGRYLDTQKAGTRAVCLLSPMDENREAIQAGLAEGLAGGIPVEFAVLTRQGDQQGTDRLTLTPSLVASVLEQHPGTDLLVCMVNLPWDPGQLAGLLRQREVRLAAGNVFDPGTLTSYVRAGVFAGAAVFRDDPAPFGAVKQGTPKQIFDAHYILVPARDG